MEEREDECRRRADSPSPEGGGGNGGSTAGDGVNNAPDDAPPWADDFPAPVELPIDGILDLHQFPPREAADLVREYLDACRERGVLDVRIIHGKGIGALRELVHAQLKRHPAVESFALAGDASGWGATLVRLRPRNG